jgi:hypothetical protein
MFITRVRLTAQADNDANLASQFLATNRSKFADLKARADCNSICFPVHGLGSAISLYRNSAFARTVG